MKKPNLISISLVIILCLSFSLQVNSTVDITNYSLVSPLPIADFYIGEYSNGSFYSINGSNWNIHMVGSDVADILQDIIASYNGYYSIRFGTGTFDFFESVDFGDDSYFSIMGAGHGTVLKLMATIGATTDFLIFNYTDWNQGRFIIKDLTIDATGQTYTSQHAVYILGGDRWSIDNVRIYHAYQDGLYVTEIGSNPVVTYASIRNLCVRQAGRYGVYFNGRDSNFWDLNVESTGDSNVVINGNGNYIYGAHLTYAHAHYDYEHGAGNDRYSSLELLGSSGVVHGLWADKAHQYGIYVAGDYWTISDGRVYYCDYQQGSDGYADIYLTATATYNRVVQMYLRAASGDTTNYGVVEIAGADWNIVKNNIAFDHQINGFTKTGANSIFGDNLG